jgi:hypothetical protein
MNARPLGQPRARRLDGWVCGRMAGRDQSYCHAPGTVRRHPDLVRIGKILSRSGSCLLRAHEGLAKGGVQYQSSLQSQHVLELQSEYG